ncbi:MAG: SDR family NAD(P)-dependent oxidoreductase [Pseudomonadota bacterium]|nr:3-hydroxyacyl-CoA dehydrogenase [Alphaproteobacteria bacterium]MEC7577094.1 SDR family NAD(P)-dependent oxidoreductase [Pseudomonadota bacterium]MEC7702599.1 SDR family NAD(P)-dependent oxidoreductase [Pseudomonadota bacterium]MEC9235233.1 SDR family NAD(P)-dependent oxidoreductase [Pseudomonadota bacterium]|tara:strand:- start:22832 stop:23590 length:759 start_codon:yes stop_codon:yes gene_type:complete
MQLKDKVAIVTGGSGGIGAATVKYLRDKGAKVASWDLHEPKDDARLDGVVYIACDIVDETSVLMALGAVKDALGLPQIVVHCAGILGGERILGRDGVASLERFQKIINVNLNGTFNVLRLSAEMMAANEADSESGERGVIINTGSIAGYEGQIGQAAYAASKGGVASMTLPIARELARVGIRVMTIAPGAVETPMMDNVPLEYKDAITANIPFPSRFAKAEEFAMLAAHIVENPMLNGEIIRLDGAARLPSK